jgi:RHS repeat-associated protein
MDAFGNLTVVYEPDPTTGAPGGPATYYAYNGANQLTNVWMTRGSIQENRTFTYDGNFNMTSENTPDGGLVTYAYDGNHHVTERVDALGQKTDYSYDGFGRLTSVQHWAWGNPPYCNINCTPVLQERPEQNVNYYYDLPMGGYTQNNTWGRLSGVTFNQGVAGGMSFRYQYNYTTGGRVAGNRMLAGVTGAPNAPIDLQARYMWDTQGRMTSVTYPSGPTLTYGFDAMGRANAVTGALGSRSFNGSATYGSAGQLTAVSAGEAWTDSQGTYYNAGSNNGFTYNNMLQLTRIGGAAGTEIDVPGLPATGMGNQSLDVAYVYNAGHNNGRVIQTIDYGVNETVNYTYDYLHRLTSATGGSMGNETYSWDGFGNLIAKTPTSGNMPAYSGGVGQNATGGALDPRFDVEQRFRGGGDSPGFGYDPWGHRIFSQIGAASGELWFYGADGRKLDTYQWAIDSNNVLYATEHGITRYMAGRLMEDNGVFMASDRLGSVRAISTSNALISYFPWGEERPQPNGATTPDGMVKFSGYYRDHPGQNYAGARYYNEGGGYFTSPDPAGLAASAPGNPASWNRGAFVLGDPINLRDFTGREPENPECTWDGPTSTLSCPGDDGPSPTPSPIAPASGPGSGDQQTGQGGPPAPKATFRQQVQWMSAGWKSLATFKTTSKDCLGDLSAFGLTPDDVDKVAANDHLVNGLSIPSVVARMGPGVDFVAVFETSTIYYDGLYFWQQTNSDMLGTLLHEIIHNSNQANAKLTDSQLQQKLGVKVDPGDTTDISKKLAMDCFKGN